MKLPAIFHGLSRTRRGAVAASCREVSRELRGASEATERDFLAVGAKLGEILEHARTEAETLTRLQSALTGEAGTAVAEAVDEVMSWAEGARDEGQRGDALAALAPVVTAVRTPLTELCNSARMLRVAGVVTRVESARLGSHSAGFVSVADEVASLATDIDGKSESGLDAVEGLRQLIHRTGQTVLVAERNQNRDLIALLAECRAGIDALHAGQERCFATCLRAQSGYGGIVEKVGRMVVSLQFHDSTRQRLEHVDEALIALAARLESAGDASGAAAVVELQAAQLEEARRTFLTSAARIRSELDAIRLSSADLGLAARQLAESGTGDGSATGLDRRFSAVVSTIDEWNESHRSLVAAAGDVAGGCSRVATFVSDIQHVGMRLLRLALNAQVEAVRLEESGAVMEAVAGGIGGISQAAGARAEQAGAALVEAEAAVVGFARLLEGDDSASSRAQAAAARIHALTGELESSLAGTGRMLSDIVERGETLAAQIAALSAGFSADTVMEAATARCAESLAAIAQALAPHPGRVRTAGDLAAAAELYTMQHERDVHAAVTGAETAAAPEPALSGESDLGTNVELF